MPAPERLDELLEFAWNATLLPLLDVATRGGLFEAALEPATVAGIAAVTGFADSPVLDSLLRTLTAAGLLEQVGADRFRASDLAREALVRGEGPRGGEFVSVTAGISGLLLERFDDFLRRPVEGGLLPRWDSPEGTEAATSHSAAMGALTLAAACAEVADVLHQHPVATPVHRVLDLGAGAGGFALALAEACPEADVVLLDRDSVLDVARSATSGRPGAERLRFLPGDLLGTPFPADCDIVLASHSLICELDQLDTILCKVASCLAPGGALLIRYFERLDSARDQGFSTLLGDVLNHAMYGYGQIVDRATFDMACRQARLAVVAVHRHPTSHILVARRVVDVPASLATRKRKAP